MSREPRPAPTSHWLRVGGLRYHALVAVPPENQPAARPLVLVHGNGVSSAYWSRLQPLLAVRRPVYAVDLPGCGRSETPRTMLDVPRLGAALAGWLAAAGLERVDLLGHSLGGQIVADVAHHCPGRVGRLVLAAPSIGRPGPGAARRWALIARDALREPASLLPAVVPAYLRCGPRRIVCTDLLAGRDDLPTTLARVSQPVLVVRGTRDCVVSRADVRRLLDVLPGRGRLVELPDAAHALHWRRPHALARIVDAFLSEGLRTED
jgi:pimeloyl-ACP methyl ester carboxylesterase